MKTHEIETLSVVEEPVTVSVDSEFLAHLGEGHVAYVKAIRSDDVGRLFPEAPAVRPGLTLFALLSASGAPILLTDNRETAVASAMAQDLQTVSVH